MPPIAMHLILVSPMEICSRRVSKFLLLATPFQVCCWAIVSATLLLPCHAYANDLGFLAPADTSSPRATLKSFIDASNQVNEVITSKRYIDRNNATLYAPSMRILDCLDQSQLPDYERTQFAAESALCLKEIIDRVELPPFEEIPGPEDVSTDDGSPGIPRWRIPGTRIVIAQIQEGPQQFEYLFSAGTVARASSNYRDVKHLPYRTTGPDTSPGIYDWYVSAPANAHMAAVIDTLPSWMRNRVWGVAIWQWGGLAIATVLGFGVMLIAYRLEWYLIKRFREKRVSIYVVSIVLPIFAACIPLVLRSIASGTLTIRGTPLYVISFAFAVVSLLASCVVIFGSAGRVSAAIISTPRINPKGLDAQFIRILARLLSIAGVVVIFVEGGGYLGIPVTTLIASAGIGGLAVALAAQDMLKNLFGTIMLLMDKPFRCNERIKFGKYDGVVEEIGLRSTKIRLLNGHQATVPNDELARSDIENVDRRQFIRQSAKITFPSATPAAKLKRAVEIVNSVLEDHDGMDENRPPRVFLRDFNESSVGLFVMYWYHPPVYWEFLAFTERVNLEIIDRFEAEQIPFAAPALTVELQDHEVADSVAGDPPSEADAFRQ